MKSHPVAAGLAFVLAVAASVPALLRAELHVHEWGTFTVLQGSDGIPLRWYLPQEDQHALPEYVHRPQERKTLKAMEDGLALARMETPVIYFYPDREMPVTVSASVRAGRLSEWFPDALRSGESPTARVPCPASLQWVGRLLAPDRALDSSIPRTYDAAGLHYEAARMVPEAWIFESSLPSPVSRMRPAPVPDSLTPPAAPAGAEAPVLTASIGHGEADRPSGGSATEAPSDLPERDRLIFYRGAADLTLPVSAVSSDDPAVLEISAGPGGTVPAVFAVQASTAGIAWRRLENLLPAEYVEGRNVHLRTLTFPEPAPHGTAIAELRREMTATLTAGGLTPAEAAAMVATWRDLWFGESGTRLLAVLPRGWVDETVPLSVQPAPASLARVYVGRLEILTRSREAAMMEILTSPAPPAEAAARLKALELGRFTPGALQRARHLAADQFESRLISLRNTGP